MHVDLFAKDLLNRVNQAWVRTEQAKGFAVKVGGERGARRAALFAPYFRSMLAIDRLGLRLEKPSLRPLRCWKALGPLL